MITKKEFLDRKIANKKSIKVLNTFNKICPDFYAVTYSKPSEYVDIIWNDYLSMVGSSGSSNSMNGKMFEYILISLLIRENIFPFYYQTQITFVPNVNFDFFIYTEDAPITISVKTSLRERYKQAVLEADSMLDVHRNSLNYLISLDHKALATVDKKMKKREIISLTDAIYVFSDDFDRFIYLIKSKKVLKAPNFNLVHKSQTLIL